jgi:hypothetical protein
MAAAAHARAGARRISCSGRMTETWRRWATEVRQTANGRIEALCNTCKRAFWFSEREKAWGVCPHCVGWWELPEAP